MRKSLKLLAVVAVAGSLLLAGCTQEEKFTFSDADQALAGPDIGVEVKDAQNAVVTVAGSSSCPAKITEVTGNKNKITVHLKEYKEACTADYALFVFNVSTNKSGVDFSKAVFESCYADNCAVLSPYLKSS